MSGLRELDLGGCGLSAASTLEALRKSKPLAGLTALSLAGNAGLKGLLAKLAGWGVLPKLQRLAVAQTTSAAELQALFPKPSKKLRALFLASAKELAKTPAAIIGCAESFAELDIGTTSIGDDGWVEVLAATSSHSLIELHANGCSLSDDSVVALTQSKLERLGTIDLSSNKISDDGLKALAGWAGLEHVTHLRLGNNRKVTKAGYEALMAAKQFVPVVLEVGKAEAALVKKLEARYPGAVRGG